MLVTIVMAIIVGQWKKFDGDRFSTYDFAPPVVKELLGTYVE